MRPPRPPSRLCLSVVSRIEALSVTADAVEAFLAAWQVDPNDLMQVMVIVDEIASNIVQSAWPDGGAHHFRIDLHITEHAADLSLVLLSVDDGVAFDPTAMPPPDLTLGLEDCSPGGLGLFVVGEMSDSVDYQRLDGRNRLQVNKVLRRTTQPFQTP